MKRAGAPLLALVVVAAASCHGSASSDLPCVQYAGSSYSWPVDPTALTPAAWPAGQTFTQAPHAPFPAVPGLSSSVMPSLRLVSVVTEGDPLRDGIYAFGDALVASDWLKSFGAEYATATSGTHVHLDGPAVGDTMAVSDMITYVQALEPTPPSQTIYVVYLPPGTNIVLGKEQNCGCNSIGGAHTILDAAGDALAYVQRCNTSDNDSVTRIASHEVAESLTDSAQHGYYMPQGNPPWTASVWASFQGGGVEIGDLCASTFVTEGQWTYQRIWSNAAAAAGGDPCVPALPVPFFDTSTDSDWVQIAPGATVTVPVTGWSTGARPDWYVYPLVNDASSPFTATLTTDTQQPLDGVVYDAINDGRAGTLTITADPSAQSGDHVVVRIVSRSADRTDGAHYWPVGVYVP
jgi:hypothetical protein